MDLKTLDITKGGINILSWKTWIGAAASAVLIGVVAVGVAKVSAKAESMGTIEAMQNALSGLGR